MPRKPKQPAIACQFFTWQLFQRDGVFYADARGGKYDLGKHSLRTRDRDEASVRLKQLDHLKAVELGLTEAKPTSDTGSIAISHGWKLFIDYSGRSRVLGGVSSGTLKRYGAVRDKHIKFCGRHGVCHWNTFDSRMLERYGNWLAKHRADRTAYFELTLLKSVNGWLVANKHLPADSKLTYPLQKPQGTDTYCYTPAEVSAMVKHCQADTKLAWLVHVIIALAHTGLRISELAGLRWGDVAPDRKTIRVADERASRRKQKSGTARTTKGRPSRTVPIHPAFKQLLVGLKRQPDGFVFHAARGGRIRPRNVLQMFIDDVVEPLKKDFPTPAGEFGFEHGRLHSFRHYFCSQAFLGGVSEGEIREWLGHADSKMVEHYRHLRSDDAQRKMAQIEFLAPQGDRPGDVV
jgi:integrase